MKITVRALLAARQAFQNLSEQTLPIDVAYRVSRMVKALAPEFETANKPQFELFKKYGAPVDGNEEAYRLKPENLKAFTEEVTPLMDAEIEVPVEPLFMSKLVAAGAKLSPSDMGALEPFINAEK